MIKKISKFLFVIVIFIICFFIKNIDVKADECTYMTPMTYINSSNDVMGLAFRIKYYQHEAEFNDYHYAVTGFVDSLRLSQTGNTFSPGVNLDPANPVTLTPDANRGKEITTDKLDFNSYTPKEDESADWVKRYSGCPEFIKLYKNGSKYYFDSSTEEEYKEYLKSGRQYLENSKSTTYFYAQADNLTNEKIGSLASADFQDYLFNSEPVFVSTSRQEAYSTKKWDKLVNEINKFDGNTSDTQKALTVMESLMDTGSYDTRAYSKIYYDVTNAGMYNYMKPFLNDSVDNINYISKRRFIRWFYYVGRYTFENNIDSFIDYFKFMYGDASDKTKVRETAMIILPSSVLPIQLDQDTYTLLLTALESLKDLNVAVTKEETITEDKCLVFCPNCLSSSPDYGCSQCKDYYAGEYTKCHDALKQAYEKCKNIPYSVSQNDCEEGEAKKLMGEDLYNRYIQKNEELKAQIEADKNNAINQFIGSLSRVDLPTLNIKVGQKYEVKCSDVSIFHTIYVIITIAAPVLVVVLGSLDYAQAVLASDEKKMQESKKKLPKRIIALVLLILVPLFIKIILGLFTNLDSSLLDCVVNG